MSIEIYKLGLKRPLSVQVTEVSKPFWDGLARGQFYWRSASNVNAYVSRRAQFVPTATDKVFLGKALRGTAWFTA